MYNVSLDIYDIYPAGEYTTNKPNNELKPDELKKT